MDWFALGVYPYHFVCFFSFLFVCLIVVVTVLVLVVAPHSCEVYLFVSLDVLLLEFFFSPFFAVFALSVGCSLLAMLEKKKRGKKNLKNQEKNRGGSRCPNERRRFIKLNSFFFQNLR